MFGPDIMGKGAFNLKLWFAGGMSGGRGGVIKMQQSANLLFYLKKRSNL